MGYPENILADGEHVVLHRHPHWKCLIVPTLIFLVATAAAGVAGGYTSSSRIGGNTELVLWIIIAAVWLGVVVWFFLRPLISWRTTHFVLTDRRVTFRDGIITRSGIDIPLQRINSVEFRHGLIDRMLRTGTLIIESASDDPLSFDDIPQVEKVHALLYHEVFDSESRYGSAGESRYGSAGESRYGSAGDSRYGSAGDSGFGSRPDGAGR